MDFLCELISPVTILFAVILVGYAMGKIKIGYISLDVSAVLLVAILFGFLLSRMLPKALDEAFQNAIASYSKIGTSIFVSVIGITASFSLKLASRKTFLYLGLGALTVCSGFLCTTVLELIDPHFNKSLLLGVLCGALTSTPGLSAVTDQVGVEAEKATLGYGAAYVFGVIGAVLLVQWISRASHKQDRGECNKTEWQPKYSGLEGLVAIGISGILGEWMGKLSLFRYSLGTTGGILICGIAVGYILNQFPEAKRAANQYFHVYRNLGLVLFFVGNGIPAGYRLNTHIDIRCFLYGAIITTVSLITIYVLCRMVPVFLYHLPKPEAKLPPVP